jgi:hypothetical protein
LAAGALTRSYPRHFTFYVARPARSIPVSAIRFPQLLELASNSELVLAVTDLFHPVDGVTVELLLDGDMRPAMSVIGTPLNYC